MARCRKFAAKAVLGIYLAVTLHLQSCANLRFCSGARSQQRACFQWKGLLLLIEAVVVWNEPNNLSHWNFHLDPGWQQFADMVKRGSAAMRAVHPALPIVLGGVSSGDPDWLRLQAGYGVMDHVDWNHWQLTEWPDKIREAEQVSGKPVWVTEVGCSSFGLEEVAQMGFRRTVDLIRGKTPRIHWYSLYDLPPSWPAETRHKEAEGSSYYRHYYLGLLKHDGTPKLAAADFPCQWFHWQDHRLDDAVAWMREHNVQHLRTGLSWADAYRPDAEAWFDHVFTELWPFQVAMTLCFTPGHLGREDHHTSPPLDNADFAEFAGWAVERYASPGQTVPVNPTARSLYDLPQMHRRKAELDAQANSIAESAEAPKEEVLAV